MDTRFLKRKTTDNNRKRREKKNVFLLLAKFKKDENRVGMNGGTLLMAKVKDMTNRRERPYSSQVISMPVIGQVKQHVGHRRDVNYSSSWSGVPFLLVCWCWLISHFSIRIYCIPPAAAANHFTSVYLIVSDGKTNRRKVQKKLDLDFRSNRALWHCQSKTEHRELLHNRRKKLNQRDCSGSYLL